MERREGRAALALTLALLMASTSSAQDDPKFGMEFEFAGKGNRITDFSEMPFENYKRLMRVIVDHFEGNARDIKKVEFWKETSNLEKFPEGKRKLFRAEWKDPRGRTWIIEPEFVASTGYDGYEVVTPPMKDPKQVEAILQKLKASGLVRSGRRSGVHLTVDGNKLIKANGDAKALANLIVMHENMSPMLRRMFNPVRGGGHENYFARSLTADHPELVKAIDRLPANQRTKAKLEALFKAHEAREAEIHEADPMDPTTWKKLWKYRDMNLAKTLNINEMHDGNAKLVEFRMFDLAEPGTHRLEAELYRRMIKRAEDLAREGKTVKLTPRAPTPAGDNPAVVHTPNNPNEAKAKAREMIETLGLDPTKYEALLDKNIQPRELRTRSEFEGVLKNLPGGRTVHNGKAMTYGFELEGRGAGLVNIATPTDAAVARRWNRMSEAEKKAHYRATVGENHSSVKSHFKLDTAKHPWLSDYWYVEGSGNWEIHSKVMEDLGKAAEAMRKAKTLTGKSAKGFHLHMRDNAPDWDKLEAKGSEFADFIERASNWVYLKRVERLRTDLSLKSWSNARLPPSEIDNVAALEETDRATIRVAEVSRGTGNNNYIDLEIRGFTKYVDDIETLGKIFSNGLKTTNFGSWKHTDNRLPSDAWGSAPKELRFEDHVERYLKEVEGKSLTPERAKIIKGLQESWANKAGGETRAYPTGVATPLLNWSKEASVPESVRYHTKFATEEYLGWLTRYADRIQSGEFGLDMSLASKSALMEKLGLTSAEADAVISARRANGGKISPEAALRAAVLRNGTAAEANKVGRLDKVDLNKADGESIRARTGITKAKVNKLLDYRDAHDIEESMRKAGLNANKRRGIHKNAGVFDLSDADVTAEKIKARTGLSISSARKVVDFRDAHTVETSADLKKAGLDASEISEVLEFVKPGVDISNLSATEIAEKLGISEAKAKKLVEARTANRLRSFNDVVDKVGLTEAAKNKLRGNVRTLADLNRLTADQLIEKAGITRNQADKLVTYRDASNIKSEKVLRSVLGSTTGANAYAKVAGLNASFDALERLVDSDIARKIVNYRDAHRIGKATELASYSPYLAEEMLTDAEVLNWQDADKIERMTRAIDLSEANKSELKRVGLSEAEATKVLAFRDAHTMNVEALKKAGFTADEAKKVAELSKAIDPKTANLRDIMSRTGLTRAKAEKLKRLAGVDFNSATVEKLVRAGLTRERAKRLIEFRDKAAEAEGINYKEVVRKLRLRVRKWVRESGLSDALLRSLLPRPDVTITRSPGEAGEGFASVRRGKPGEVTSSKISYEKVAAVFASVRAGAVARNDARMAEAEGEAVKSNLKKALGTIEGLGLEIVESNDIIADRAGKKVRVSTGLLNEIHARAEALPVESRPAFRARVLGLIMGHEAAHAGGLKAEKLADAEAIKIMESAPGMPRVASAIPVTKAEIRAAVDVFDKPTGATHVDNFFNRLRSLFRYGTVRGRRDRLERAAEGKEVDKLAKYRRADGTLKWKQLTKDRVLREGTGTAHFALALFLKELAVVVQTGDRARIEEFFDGLLTTDFYKEYGLFVIGARAGELAYVKYLQKYVKPKFVNGVLKSNLVLATGLALPAIVRGDFSGKTFAISLGSLSLSSTAVKAGASGIKWLYDLKKAKKTGAIAKAGMNASRLARFGGWFYTAVELAVILYVAEDIEHAVTGYLDRRAARNEIAAAGKKLFGAAGDPKATPESLGKAADTYDEAWTKYRDFLYNPLHMDEAIFMDRLEKAAKRAKVAADRNKAIIDNLKKSPALRRNIERRYGSLEKYAAHLTRKSDAELKKDIETYSSSYNKSREKHLKEIYDENKRGTNLLKGVDNLDWLLLGGRAGAEGDPWAGRSDLLARLGRGRAGSALEDALDEASLNRLETYDDQASVLSALRAALLRAGKKDLAESLDESLALTKKARGLDDQLAHGKSGILDTKLKGTGAAEALERATDKD